MRRLGLLALALAAGCAGGAPGPAEPRGWTARERETLAALRLVETLPPDPTNRWADDPAAAALGRALFYDPALSPSGTVSCATCHDPAKHFTDGMPKSRGVGVTARHTPTIEGVQFGPWFFWDGRADSLWSQAAGPLEHPDEMASDRTFVARTVVARYGDRYAAIFGEPPDLSDPARFPPHARPAASGEPTTPAELAWAGMSEADRDRVTGVFVNVLKAIAAFERTVLPSEAPFDRYVDAVLAGDPTGGGVLDDAQIRGLRLFLRDGNCVSCHHGPMFTDNAFHVLAVPEATYDPGRILGAAQVRTGEFSCNGRWSDTSVCEELRFLNPAFEDFRGAFKTPTLRNVTATAPYMHHGQFPDLRAVLAFYSELPGQPAIGHRELTLQPLHLTAEQVDDLVAFLGALEAPVREHALPPPEVTSAVAP